MKKILLIGILMFFITGCSVDYEINFGKNIDETIVFDFDEDIYKTSEKIKGDSFYIEEVLVNEKIPSLVEFKDYYNKSIKVENNKSNVTLKYTYNYDNFEKSYLINECFEKSIVINSNDYYYIALGGNFNCFGGNEITVKIKTDYEIVKENSDKVNNGYHIWEIKSENEDKKIEIHLLKELSSKDKKKFKFSWKIFVGIIIILFVGAFLLIKEKLINN